MSERTRKEDGWKDKPASNGVSLAQDGCRVCWIDQAPAAATAERVLK